jgi:hypothetical protein
LVQRDRMFHVLVLGGIALVGSEGCGGSVAVHSEAGAQEGGGTEGGFPSELPVQVDASVRADAAIDAGFLPETDGTTGDAAAREAGPVSFDATPDGICLPCELQ